MKAIIDVLGWSGSVLIILAYALTLIENRKYLDYGKYLNLLGGLLIAINCYYYNAIPSFVTNSLWSVIATLTIYKSRNKKDECKKLFKFDPSVLFGPFCATFRCQNPHLALLNSGFGASISTKMTYNNF